MPSAIDIFIVFGAIVFFVLGIKGGFTKSFLSIVGVYGEIYLAQLVTPVLIKSAAFLNKPESQVGYVGLFFTLFIVFFVIVEFLLSVFKNIVNLSFLGPFDKVLGGIISIFKAFLIAGMVIEVILILPLNAAQIDNINRAFLKEWAVDCFQITYPFALKTAGKTSEFISGQVAPKIQQQSSLALGMITAEASKLSGKLK